jgi:hypothetical protein
MRWPTKRSAREPTARDPKPAAQPPESLTDQFLDSYVDWREACEDVSTAYERWVTSELPRRDFAFERYRAALDWEEHAARVHADRAGRIRGSVARL